MSPKPPRVQCSKCAAPAAPGASKCLKCDSRLIKICGSCGFQNSLAKNYCDSCGTPQPQVDLSKDAAPRSEEKPPPLPPAPPPEPKPKPEAAKPPPAEKNPDPAPQPPPRKEEPPAKKEATFELKLPSPPSASLGIDLPRTRLIQIPEESLPAKPPPSEFVGAKPAAEKPKPASPPPQGKPAAPEKPKPAAPPRMATPAPTRKKPAAAPVASTIAGVVLLVLGAIVYVLHWQYKRSPKALLLLSANKYLSALQAHEYDVPYSMLSWEARKACQLEDFKKSQDSAEWTFGAISAEEVAKDRALVRYNLQVQGGEVRSDWLRFVWEDDHWARAYWWSLSGKIEDALDAGDADTAIADAQAAVKIDPDDPMAQSYLSEAAYLRGDSDLAERSSLQALELAKKYPSELDDKGLYHLHALLGDLYKNRLNRYADAARQFDILLALPGLEASQQCDVYAARGETRYLTQQYASALADFKDAAMVCSDRTQLEFVQRAGHILEGKAGSEAVKALQYQIMPGSKFTYLEWSKNETDERFSRAETPGAKAAVSRSEDAWVPEYAGGSMYRVLLRTDRREILSAQVDLWTRKVKVEMNVH